MVNATRRKLTFGEEMANVITHGISALGILILMPIIYIILYQDVQIGQGSIRDVIGVTIFLISIFLMLLMSTLYHAMQHDTEHKFVMRKMDHIFIFVAIAGTYTPLALSIMWEIPGYGKIVGIIMLIVQWSLVLAGVLIKALTKKGKFTTTVPIYMIMGWILVLIFPIFYKYVDPVLFWCILIGGLMYTLGAIFLALDKIKYMHMIWHFFVTFGAVAHIIGICFFLR